MIPSRPEDFYNPLKTQGFILLHTTDITVLRTIGKSGIAIAPVSPPRDTPAAKTVHHFTPAPALYPPGRSLASTSVSPSSSRMRSRRWPCQLGKRLKAMPCLTVRRVSATRSGPNRRDITCPLDWTSGKRLFERAQRPSDTHLSVASQSAWPRCIRPSSASRKAAAPGPTPASSMMARQPLPSGFSSQLW
jgi:hypothetical protein